MKTGTVSKELKARPRKTAPEATDYDLAIDSQVEKFVEIKQKLTYFIITASVGVTAFVINFVVANLKVDDRFLITTLQLTLISGSAIAALVAAGSSVLNLHLEHRSFARHLRFRYQRETWAALSKEEVRQWNRTNTLATGALKIAFVSLFGEISLAVAFFMTYFW